MGAEIHERNLDGCSPIWGIHRSSKNDMWSLYQEDRAKKNGQCLEPVLPQQIKNLDEGCLDSFDKEKVKQTILIHESIFKHQLQELHRLYGKQRELMSQFARNEVEPGLFSSHIASENNGCERIVPHVPPMNLVYGQSSQSGISCNQSFLGFNKEANTVVPFPSKGIISSKAVIDVTSQPDASVKMRSCNASNGGFQNGDVSRSLLPTKRGFELADLNEPILIDETTDSGSADDPGHSKREDKSATPNSVLKRNSISGSCFKSFQSVNGMDSNEQSSHALKNSNMMQAQNISRDLSAAFQSSKGEEKNPNGIATSEQDLTVNRRKRKLFGVEIFEVNDVKSGIDSSTRSSGNSLPNLNLISNTGSPNFVPEDRSHADLVKSVELLDLSEGNHPAKVPRRSGENPFHRVDNAYGVNKNFHHLNLDSLQNCHHQFFKNSAPPSSQKLLKKAEKVSPEITREIDDSHLPSHTRKNKALYQDLNIPSKSSESTVLEDPINFFDLNLSLVEEEPAITKVELGVPTVDKEPTITEADNEPITEADNEAGGELMRLAAEAIVAISAEEDMIDHDVFNNSPLQERSDEVLQWFAEVVSSHESQDKNVDSIPDGMDDYEYMTLQLEEMKYDDHYPAPFLENNKEDEEAQKTASLSRRPRRGQARRGRQHKKDFQRDVLPGIVPLSKLQMIEDFQTFEELMKASGSTWQSSLSKKSSGKSRGRKRKAPAPPAEEVVEEQKPVPEEDKTLTGWGKRTRRLPRLRSGAGASSSPTKNS